eukprot:gene10466-31294_t
MTDWLGMPTSLYNPMYSARNVYIEEGRYQWSVDPASGSALPIDAHCQKKRKSQKKSGEEQY